MRLVIWCVFILSLSGCSPIKIHDDEWCVDAGKFGAECFYTISDKERSLDKYQWDKLRLGQTCSATPEPSKGFINLKTALEKACSDTNRCTPEEKKNLKKAISAINAVQKKAARAYDRVKRLK